jgi:hypothetical protein
MQVFGVLYATVYCATTWENKGKGKAIAVTGREGP